MLKSYEVVNSKSGHSFGFYAGTDADDAIRACCHEAGYSSVQDAADTMGRASDLTAQRVATVPAARYADSDDSLQAAAADYAAAHGLAGWDLAPRWEHGARDSLRETIVLSIPEHVPA